MTSDSRSPSQQSDEVASRRGHPGRTGLLIVVILIALPLLLFTGCRVAIEVMNDRATAHLAEHAESLVAGTPWADVPVEQLPGYGTSGSVLCMDNCLYLSFDVPAPYAATVEDNMARAGWSVDIPGCLTSPERFGPPCGLLDQDGALVGLASYWPGPSLTLMLGPG